jgi:hypothetical protein
MRLSFAIGALLSFFIPAQALAQTGPILLWGFQRGCTPLADAARDVQQHLETTVTGPTAHTEYLSPDPKLIGCQGAACAEIATKLCTEQGAPLTGRIMGGSVDMNAARTLVRMRLWLHDLQTGKTAFHDNYCSNCDITSTLKVNAAELAQYPNFGAVPNEIPIYCQPEQAPKELPARSNKIFSVVFGKEYGKAAITAAVRKTVQQTGTEVPLVHQGQQYSLEVFKKIVAKEPGAQVLGAEIKNNGVVELFLYDDPTELVESQLVECPACSVDLLAQQVKQATISILSHCFGDSCARAGRRRPPAEACRPLETLQCGSVASLLLTSAARTSHDGEKKSGGMFHDATMSPSLAKLGKGVLWGLFAAEAAATATLLIADFSGPPAARDTLLPAAGATGAISLLTLGAAIPLTILFDRASAPRPATRATPPPSSAQQLLLQCPRS